MNSSVFFNAHHSPIGAFATLTLGCKGPLGGLGIELRGPADESVYVGVENRDEPGRYQALPFFGGPEIADTSSDDYDVEGLSDFRHTSAISSFADAEISRRFGASVDEWSAGDLTFRIVNPVGSIPDPANPGAEPELRDKLTPGVLVELTVDNRQGTRPRKAFFGFVGSDRATGMRVWEEGGLLGVGQGSATAIGTSDPDVYAGVAWQPEAILDPRHPENLRFILGNLGLLVGVVQPGEIRTFEFAVGFFREGTATTGLRTRYLYRRWFDRVEAVVGHVLSRSKAILEEAERFDARLQDGLTPERALMLAHAVRSYYGATQCLEREDDTPLWVVNEGEYRMMNTFDLTVDQAFFELALNPWTVRNELDLFVERYSYVDEVRFPGEERTYEGGIAFTHDMGIANTFSEPGRSGYEQAGLRGVFSYMSAEELVNWCLCGCLYAAHTGDFAWVESHRATFLAVLRSLINRDHPDPALRNGVIGLDSSRCKGGSEITTYDSLDASLGQARNNLYLAVKTWAAYVLLEPIFERLVESNAAQEAQDQARKCAATVVGAVDPDGLLPAVIGEGGAARIIPAIEGLVYPFVAGRTDVLEAEGPYSEFLAVLARHFREVLKPGVCRFPDGGWRLSSTSRNSWLSKIYLCQFVAERILGQAVDAEADEAHLAWLMETENAYFAWSDQMVEGKAAGSRYYPRGVTAILWTSEAGRRPLDAIRDRLTAEHFEMVTTDSV